MQSGGTLEVTYNGKALYTFVVRLPTRPGDRERRRRVQRGEAGVFVGLGSGVRRRATHRRRPRHRPRAPTTTAAVGRGLLVLTPNAIGDPRNSRKAFRVDMT